MRLWRIGVLGLALVALFLMLGKIAFGAGGVTPVALPTIHLGNKLPVGECQPNEKSGYNTSKRYPATYVEKGITKTSLWGKGCQGMKPPKLATKVKSECVQDYQNTGKCVCVEWIDQNGKSHKCDAADLPKSVSPGQTEGDTKQNQTPNGEGTAKSKSTGSAQDSTAAAKPGGSGDTATPKPKQSAAQSSDGSTGSAQAGTPSPGNSALQAALNPEPVDTSPQPIRPMSQDDTRRNIDQVLGEGGIGDVTGMQPAEMPQGADARMAKPSFGFDSQGSLAMVNPPTDSFGQTPGELSASFSDGPSEHAFAHDNTFPNSNRGAAESTDCSSIASCAAVYATKAYDATVAAAKDAWNGTAEALGKAFTIPAEGSPFDRTALGSIEQTTKAFCDTYGCQEGDATPIAQAIAGACAQEAGGCNPDVKHILPSGKPSQYQGLPQTNQEGVEENANTFKFLAENPYIQMSDSSRAQFQRLSDRYDELVAKREDPRKDPEVGAAMLVAQQFNLDRMRPSDTEPGVAGGLSPALVAADYARDVNGVIDPLKAAAVIQTAQICPSCVQKYAADPGARLTGVEAGYLNSRANRVNVAAGQPVSNAFDEMLASRKNYAANFASGIRAQTQFGTYVPQPAFVEPQVAYTAGNLGGGNSRTPVQPLGFAAMEQSPESLSGIPFPGDVTQIRADSYAPYGGGPTPLFAQGSPAAHITGIGGGRSAPAFTGQSYYAQPDFTPPPAVSMGYTNPSQPYSFSGSSIVSDSGSYGQLGPSRQPLSAGYANPSYAYSLPNSYGGSSGSFYPQLNSTLQPLSSGYQNPLYAYTNGASGSFYPRLDSLPQSSIQAGYENPGSSYRLPQALGGSIGSFYPSLDSVSARYGGGPLPIFARGSVAEQLTGISGSSPRIPTFVGQSFYPQPQSLGGNDNTVSSGRQVGPYEFSGSPLSSFGGNPASSLSNAPMFAQQRYYAQPEAPSSGSIDRVSADDALQQAQQESQRLAAREYAASLYDQALNAQASSSISPSSDLWRRYIDVGPAELGMAKNVGAPHGTPPAAAADELAALTARMPVMQPAFDQNLGFGARGGDVRALQQRLIDEGYLHLVHGPSGYFGVLTRNAVVRYQAAHGISRTGFVGPITRGALNR